MEQITIDEKYTYQFDEGRVQILRHGQPWLGAETGSFPGVSAWIAAANEIEDLRSEHKRLADERRTDADGLNYALLIADSRATYLPLVETAEKIVDRSRTQR